jgi:hypothetical protein
MFDPVNNGSVPRGNITEFTVDSIVLNRRNPVSELLEENRVAINNVSDCLILKVSWEEREESEDFF